jgi:glutamine synthetase
LLEKSLAGGVDFDAAVQQLLTEVIAEHGAVVFNGEWRERCRRSS